MKYTKERCPKGHRWSKGVDPHGCRLRVCIRCTNEKGQSLWVFEDCKVSVEVK